jgi:pimeloyl-ACP methyl ester carboxylesterase
MPWRLAASYPDYLSQLSALLRDPVYYGVKVPPGKGQPVLLIPGFLAGDWTLTVMAGWLNRMGYRSYLSGIDWNIDCPNKTAERLRWRLDYIARETESPIVAVGHSLGGMLARFLVVNFPEQVRHAVALGSPIAGEALNVHPLVPLLFRSLLRARRQRGDTAPLCGSPQCTCRFSQSAFAALPPGVSFTSIFTKRDEIVDWRSCVDPQGENQQVSGRHLGLIVNREVYRILARTLADWQSSHAAAATAR